MSKVAYVVKRYPRFSETFVVNELLAHEQAGLEIEVFSLRPPIDTHFQDLISQVRAPVTYLSSGSVKAMELWDEIRKAQGRYPAIVQQLGTVANEDALDVYCGIKLANMALQRGISHFHAHFASSAASVARIASKLSGIPYSMTAHAKDIFHNDVNLADLRNKIADSSTTITISDYNRSFLQQRFHDVASAKVVRLYNGMHVDQFPYQSPLSRPARIIAVGRLVEKKGFEYLVHACDILRAKGVPFSCCIVGGGESQSSLEMLIGAKDLEGCVRLLGPQPQNVVKSLIANASVMVAPCIDGSDGNRDGIPTVLLEAMALGTPCVSTEVTGIPEVVNHGMTGLLVQQKDAVGLADAIALLLSDGNERARLSMNARMLIEKDFDVRQNAALQRSMFSTHANAHSSSDLLQLAGV